MIDKAFDEWWNADSLVEGNPFRRESPAFWAWEGWHAGHEAGIQEGMRREHAMWVLAKVGQEIEHVHAVNISSERVQKTEENEHDR